MQLLRMLAATGHRDRCHAYYVNSIDCTKVIQPFETGVVRSIRVQDGQAVKTGDVLIELDPTVNAAERDHLRNDLLGRKQLNIARLRAALGRRRRSGV